MTHTLTLNNQDIDRSIDSVLNKLPEEVRRSIKQKLNNAISYTPKIGVMGKSGAGKSSLVNAIVGKPACKTGGVGGCTREFQEERISIGKREIIFMDLPGIAENKERNDEYAQLYQSKIEDLDIILWLIKIDDRANKDDQEFYGWLIKNYKKERIIFVLSQCDKAFPSREFDYSKFTPSQAQKEIIMENQERLESDFQISSLDVIPVASEYYEGKFNSYNLDKLIARIIHKVPNEAKSSVYATVNKEHRSGESKTEAKGAFRSVVDTLVDVVIDYIPLPTPVKTVARKAKDVIVDGIVSLWDKIFG